MSARRRSNFNAQSVSYGTVGASLAPDLLRYPPRGFWVAEDSARLGTGRERFESAREQMWQWGIHLNSGLEVVDVVPGSEGGYRGLNQRDIRDVDPNEVMFTAQGHAYVNPGATILQRAKLWRWTFELPARVVLVIDEEQRAGYALGSLPGHPFVGEQAFVLELRDDDSVWLTVRQLGQPENPRLRILAPLLRWQQQRLTKRFLMSLHPAAAALLEPTEPTESDED
ncbi:MAG: DUF1990 family protein [Agromyces sp.]